MGHPPSNGASLILGSVFFSYFRRSDTGILSVPQLGKDKRAPSAYRFLLLKFSLFSRNTRPVVAKGETEIIQLASGVFTAIKLP